MEEEGVWTPHPCGIVLEASGLESHEAEGGPVFPEPLPSGFLWEGFLSGSQTALPNFFLRWL